MMDASQAGQQNRPRRFSSPCSLDAWPESVLSVYSQPYSGFLSFVLEMIDNNKDKESSKDKLDSLGRSFNADSIEPHESQTLEEKIPGEKEEDKKAEKQDDKELKKVDEKKEEFEEVKEEEKYDEEDDVENEDEEKDIEKEEAIEELKEEVDMEQDDEEREELEKEDEEKEKEEQVEGLSSGEILQPKFLDSNRKVTVVENSIDNQAYPVDSGSDGATDLHETILLPNRNGGDTDREQINVVKTSGEDYIEMHADIAGPESAVDNDGVEVDKKKPVYDEKESIRLNDNQCHSGRSDDSNLPKCERGVDDDSVSASHLGTDAPLAGSSALKVDNVKKELIDEKNMKPLSKDVNHQNLNQTFIFETDASDGGESGTEEEQSAFIKELENFFKDRSLEFKTPKFYGEPLNCLKLWRAVTRLGGYDKVTACKLWRQVGESFKPPKTCTTVSWTFRIFYEKALLDYEKHKTCGGEISIPVAPTEPTNIENQVGNNQALGSGRARRDAAARAMQGWHSQRLLGNGEVSDPIIKDKSSISLQKREKQLKNIGVLKRKRPSTVETVARGARSKVTKTQLHQLDTTVIDIGPPAEWVKINVQITKDCYEVYALVPGLLREEVHVQSDPAGRLVITGEPENPDNPWGVTPFKKVVSLPSRIDPHQTSAVVTLHGQLFVRVPFEQSD
ncbi:hypothetical protein Nepgr_025838 [Nepenthes gracilis]|uniref:Uncharacterized protein n=1 Tax=Nepenthes gracilis TaxID=150966 RepID=A0AAD3T6R1_NEPGR|nr:hypothetical protein Nepgr_025838 [Nepenthes gracilis]